MLSKNANNKKCAPKFVFFNIKKSVTSPLHQFAKFIDDFKFTTVDFLAKKLSNFSSLP